jgi:hypothetical protein
MRRPSRLSSQHARSNAYSRRLSLFDLWGGVPRSPAVGRPTPDGPLSLDGQRVLCLRCAGATQVTPGAGSRRADT